MANGVGLVLTCGGSCGTVLLPNALFVAATPVGGDVHDAALFASVLLLQLQSFQAVSLLLLLQLS
jgi:hypothetical protein